MNGFLMVPSPHARRLDELLIREGQLDFLAMDGGLRAACCVLWW